MASNGRQKNLDLEKLEVLIWRVAQNHPEKSNVDSWLAKLKAGHFGELSLDYYLCHLDESIFLILHNIRLKYKSYHFQIDTLIIHSRFILILEVKNYSGTLIFDTAHNQLIRIFEEREDIFNDPILQVDHQKFQLSRWLGLHGFPQIPIYTYVVVANDKAKIVFHENTPLSKKVIRNRNLLNVIEEIENKHRNRKEALDKNRVRKLNSLLKEHHSQDDRDILKKLGIKKEDLLTGVQCLVCSTLPMIRHHGRWICPKCNNSSNTAHIKALRDYFLVINSTISNKEMRQFLHIDSDNVANYLLKSLNLQGKGSTKGRRYNLESLM
ncbi:nuclease-related domain-containing protein [Pseudalkalibacillus sp. SCS-8]|uniref:nuclease-related domain-containing protein n=1 Tax=Pseudalkalibacillus nanhaiensis TaxID=3115291 RepID=UPI0032DB6070